MKRKFKVFYIFTSDWLKSFAAYTKSGHLFILLLENYQSAYERFKIIQEEVTLKIINLRFLNQISTLIFIKWTHMNYQYTVFFFFFFTSSLIRLKIKWLSCFKRLVRIKFPFLNSCKVNNSISVVAFIFLIVSLLLLTFN